MKTLLLAHLLLISSVTAATTEELVGQARGLLVQRNIPAAKARAEEAVASSPNDPDANALLAFARLIYLSEAPETTALLDRLGFSPNGRSLYRWSSSLAKDEAGGTIVPKNFTADELTAFVRTNVIPAFAASEANLAKVTNTNFLFTLTAGETSIGLATCDYADLQVCRATLNLFSTIFLTFSSWNLDVQLEALQSYFTSDDTNLREFLAAHPQLLTFARPDDLAEARTHFAAGADQYADGSARLRERTTQALRLFNLDHFDRDKEKDFRTTLADLKASLTSPVVMFVDTNLTVSFSKFFSGQTAPRQLLPSVRNGQIITGTLPDHSFGGLLSGATDAGVEKILQNLAPIGVGLTATSGGEFVEVHFATLKDHGYLIQRSSDLTNWVDVLTFVSTGGWATFPDAHVPSASGLYYRLKDLKDYARFVGLVTDACSGLPIQGAIVSFSFQPNTFLVTDSKGSYVLQATQYFQFQYSVSATAQGYTPTTIQNQFFGPGRTVVVNVSMSPVNAGAPGNDMFANRIALTGTQQSVVGTTCGATSEDAEPFSFFANDSVWYSWTAPSSGDFDLPVDWPHSSVYPSISVYSGETLNTLSQVGTPLHATAGQTYQIRIISQTPGVFAFSIVPVLPRPTIQITSPAYGARFPSGADITVTATASGSIPAVVVEVNDNIAATLTGAPLQYELKNAQPGTYSILFYAEDGGSGFAFTSFTVYPANDNFANAAQLSGSRAVVAASNRAASAEPSEPMHDGEQPRHSVWWTWTAPASGPVTIITDQKAFGPTASILAVYHGDQLATLSSVASASFNHPAGAQVTFDAVANVTYSIAVDGYQEGEFQLTLVSKAAPTIAIASPAPDSVFRTGASVNLSLNYSDADSAVQTVTVFWGVMGDSEVQKTNLLFTPSSSGTVTVALPSPLPLGYYYASATAMDNDGLLGGAFVSFSVQPPPPPNDSFAAATSLVGSSITVSATNLGATMETSEPLFGGTSSVWWTWTAPLSGSYVIDTEGSSFDTVLGVFTGDMLGALTTVAADDNSGPMWTSRLVLNAAAGTVYRLAIAGVGPYGRDQGSIILHITKQ